MLLFVLVGPRRDDSRLQRAGAVSWGKPLMRARVRACVRARHTGGILFENDAFCILKYCFEAVENCRDTLCKSGESRLSIHTFNIYFFIHSSYIFAWVHYSDESRSLLLSLFLTCCNIAPALLHYFANIKPSVSAANGKDFLHNNKNTQWNEDAS